MNWGKSITIFMVLFMGFILSMVYYAFTKNADLVEENYYENELNYDQHKINRENYTGLTDQASIQTVPDGVQIYVPATETPVKNGSIYFYRPDEKKLDRNYELSLDEKNLQLLPYSDFKEGYYDVRIEWSDAQKSYLFENNISF
ncbi:MAG: FixH family protein [Crocinitomicaceae bacterium]|nr:FixH family protein [Crocinitomicaceae bacterium]